MIELSKRDRVIETLYSYRNVNYRNVKELSKAYRNVIELSKRDRVIETLQSYRNGIELSKRDRVIET